MNLRLPLFVLADVLSKSSAILVVPIVSNTLGAEQYSVLSVLQSLIQVLIIFFAFSGNGLIPVKYVRENESSAQDAHAGFIHLGLVVLLLLLAITPIVTSLTSMKPSHYIFITFIGLFTAFSTQFLSFLRIKEKFFTLSIVLIITTLIMQLGTYIYFNLYGGNVETRLFFMLSGVAFQTCALVVFSRSSVFKFFKMRTVKLYKECVLYGASLWVHHLSYWVRAFADRLIVAVLFGAAVAGNYALSVTIASAAYMGFSALSQALQSFFYRRIKAQGCRSHIALVIQLSLYVFLSFVVFYFAADYFWFAIFSDDFEFANELFLFALVPVYLQVIYAFMSHGLFFFKKNKSVSKVSIARAGIYCLGVTICWLLNGNAYWVLLASTLAATYQIIATTYKVYKLEDTSDAYEA